LDAVEGWQIRRRVPFDGVIAYSRTHEEIKGAFLTFHCNKRRLRALAVLKPASRFGFVALYGLSGVMELAIWQQHAKKEAGNFGDPGGFSQYTDVSFSAHG
jgi:hypothetical protein